MLWAEGASQECDRDNAGVQALDPVGWESALAYERLRNLMVSAPAPRTDTAAGG